MVLRAIDCQFLAMIETPILPENAPFTPEQRAWVNGYLAGLLAQSRPQAAAAPTAPTFSRIAGKPLLVVYGSQTGSAEGIARKLVKQAESRGFACTRMEGNAAVSYDWTRETNLLLVTSTWGDGEPPDNAAVLWAKMSTDSFPKLSNARFSVLALGDKNYSNFCGAGKAFDERLEVLGAKRIAPRVDCDTDYEQLSSAWIASVLDALDGGSPSVELVNQIETAPVVPSKNKPIQATLITNRRLNTPDSVKDTRHFEISLESGYLEYEPGDALGVLPQNCPEFVSQILEAQKWSGDEVVKVKDGTECPVKEALIEKVALTKLPAPLVETFAQRAEDAFLSSLFETNNPDALSKFVQGRDVLDLFCAYPFIRLAPQELVSVLAELKPRLYSISSSQKIFPKQVHLTVNVVRYEAHGRLRKGVCSSFLADSRELPKTVGVYLHKSPSFRLPANDELPVIMIGPGTGIAPFRAFLQERSGRDAKGKNWLFFGDQRASSDFLYKEELDAFAKKGTLTRLSTAFSRDQADKIYVQHRMIEQARDLYDWLENGAHLYVCGDASRMAKDVDMALHQVISKAGGKSEEQAMDYVSTLKQTKRYLRDVY